MTDIGTGSYTIIAQTAAEMMGVPLDTGDGAPGRFGISRFRPAPAGNGAPTTRLPASIAACMKLREIDRPEARLQLGRGRLSPDGEVRSGNRACPLAEAARDGGLVAEDAIEYGDLTRSTSSRRSARISSKSASMQRTAEIRVRRMLAVCAAGRILNPKTARSQVIGAMTMGVGAALMEELVVDKRIGFFVNHDLAGYEVPVHADIPHQDVIFLDETDPMSRR